MFWRHFLIKQKSFIVLHNIVATSYVSCVKFDPPTKYPIFNSFLKLLSLIFK